MTPAEEAACPALWPQGVETTAVPPPGRRRAGPLSPKTWQVEMRCRYPCADETDRERRPMGREAHGRVGRDDLVKP
jgi:hypothetical protein